jgi:hypothetical protein
MSYDNQDNYFLLSSISNIINYIRNIRIDEGFQIPNYIKESLINIEKSLLVRYELEVNEVLFYTYKILYYNFSIKKCQKDELLSAIEQKDINKFYNELSDEHLLHLIINTFVKE